MAFSSKSQGPLGISAPALDLASCLSYLLEMHHTHQHVGGSGKPFKKETRSASFNQALPKHVSLAAHAGFFFFSLNKQLHLAKHTYKNTAAANRRTSEAEKTWSLRVSENPGAAPMEEGRRAGWSAGSGLETAGTPSSASELSPTLFALPPFTLKGAAKSNVLWGSGPALSLRSVAFRAPGEPGTYLSSKRDFRHWHMHGPGSFY